MDTGKERNPADSNSPENVAARQALEAWRARHAKHAKPLGTAIPKYEPKVVITPTMRREAKNRALGDPKN